MEDLKQSIIGFDWTDEKKGRAIICLTPETVAKLSGLPPGVVKAALEAVLASGSMAPAPIELPSDDPMARFWTEVGKADSLEGGGGMFLELKGNAFFMGRSSNQSSILLRKCYQDLWDLVTAGMWLLHQSVCMAVSLSPETFATAIPCVVRRFESALDSHGEMLSWPLPKGYAAGNEKIIITGTPGTGKTLWQFLALHKLAKMGATVVVDFKGYDDCYCFSGSSVRTGPRSAFKEELNKKATWYLVDTKEPSLYDAKTILTTSPRREIWKDFAKAGASTLLMPLWSEDELKVAGQRLYSLAEQEVHDLFAKWGGSARYVLQYARYPSRQRDLDTAISGANTDMIYKAVGNESAQEVSHRIVHMRVRDDYISSDAIFASEYIARKVGESLCAGNIIPLENFITFLACKSQYSDVRGKLFESVAHRLLARGDKFTSMNLETGQEEDWELPASSSMQTYNTLSDMPCQDDGVYWMPSSSNESAVDSLRQPSTLFQMTVAATHSINATGLSKAAQQLLSSDLELIFVVPPDMFQRWHSKQQYKGRQDLKALKNVRQRVIKIPLHALHMQSVLWQV